VCVTLFEEKSRYGGIWQSFLFPEKLHPTIIRFLGLYSKMYRHSSENLYSFSILPFSSIFILVGLLFFSFAQFATSIDWPTPVAICLLKFSCGSNAAHEIIEQMVAGIVKNLILFDVFIFIGTSSHDDEYFFFTGQHRLS